MKTAMIAVLILAAAGCTDSSGRPPAPAQPTPSSTKEFRPPAKDSLSYKTPPEWTSEEVKDNMRKAQYRIPDRKGHAAPASLTFFSMAPQSVETIVDYWREKMGGADASVGKIPGTAVPTTLVDIAGEYTGDNPPISNAQFLGAIVEAGDRNWYLKLVGPAETVAGWKDAFVEMLKGLRPIE